MELVQSQYRIAVDRLGSESSFKQSFWLKTLGQIMRTMIDRREERFMERLNEAKLNPRDNFSISGGYYI